MESEPGNGEVSKVCPLASALSDLPQRSLWNIDAIGSRIGLHVSVNLSEDTSVKCKIAYILYRGKCTTLEIQGRNLRKRTPHLGLLSGLSQVSFGSSAGKSNSYKCQTAKLVDKTSNPLRRSLQQLR